MTDPPICSREISELAGWQVQIRKELAVRAQYMFRDDVAGQELEKFTDVQAAAAEPLDQFDRAMDEFSMQGGMRSSVGIANRQENLFLVLEMG